MGRWAGGLAQKCTLRGGAPLTPENDGVGVRKGSRRALALATNSIDKRHLRPKLEVLLAD
jgi:hypothetical protein